MVDLYEGLPPSSSQLFPALLDIEELIRPSLQPFDPRGLVPHADDRSLISGEEEPLVTVDPKIVNHVRNMLRDMVEYKQKELDITEARRWINQFERIYHENQAILMSRREEEEEKKKKKSPQDLKNATPSEIRKRLYKQWLQEMKMVETVKKMLSDMADYQNRDMEDEEKAKWVKEFEEMYKQNQEILHRQGKKKKRKAIYNATPEAISKQLYSQWMIEHRSRGGGAKLHLGQTMKIPSTIYTIGGEEERKEEAAAAASAEKERTQRQGGGTSKMDMERKVALSRFSSSAVIKNLLIQKGITDKVAQQTIMKAAYILEQKSEEEKEEEAKDEEQTKDVEQVRTGPEQNEYKRRKDQAIHLKRHVDTVLSRMLAEQATFTLFCNPRKEPPQARPEQEEYHFILAKSLFIRLEQEQVEKGKTTRRQEEKKRQRRTRTTTSAEESKQGSVLLSSSLSQSSSSSSSSSLSPSPSSLSSLISSSSAASSKRRSTKKGTFSRKTESSLSRNRPKFRGMMSKGTLHPRKTKMTTSLAFRKKWIKHSRRRPSGGESIKSKRSNKSTFTQHRRRLPRATRKLSSSSLSSTSLSSLSSGLPKSRSSSMKSTRTS